MRFRLRTTALVGVLALGGSAIAMPLPSLAGCGGGGGYSRGGGYGGGHTFGAFGGGGYSRGGGYSGGGSCCGMGGMSMGGNMSGMNTGGTAMPAPSMQGMNMGGYAPPATTAPATAAARPATPTAAGSLYSCPMHPNVMSTFAATCPYCQMALKKR